MKSISIGNVILGQEYDPVVIAELGINHNGNLDQAIELADAAINAGASIIKHQTHFPEYEMSEEAKKIIPSHCNESIYEIIKKSSLSKKNEIKLKKYVNQKNKVYISTPFCIEAANFLNSIHVPAFKIGSGECNNYLLIEHISKFKKPILLSTGMNLIKDIRPAVNIIRRRKLPYVLLICTNIYPTKNEYVYLDTLSLLKSNFPDAILGISDHTNNIYCSLAAVGLGARVIEKHFVKSKKSKGPDVSSSMNTKDLKNLIKGSKIIFDARGIKKKIIKQESDTANFAFASVVAIKNIKKGEVLSRKNIFVRRPGNGNFKIKDYYKLIGKIANQDIKKNHQLKNIDVKK